MEIPLDDKIKQLNRIETEAQRACQRGGGKIQELKKYHAGSLPGERSKKSYSFRDTL